MNKNKGSITPSLLIITGAFTIVIYGILIVLTTQLDFSHRQVGSEMALNIAEAGINYYKWHLSHNPNDFYDGTGQSGIYTHNYYDPQGDLIGSYDLEIIPPTDGSNLITIESTGKSLKYPSIKRKIIAQYGKPSLARYSFLLNASVWYAEGTTVTGDIHSNNGIRMDGVNTGIVSSSRDEYMCGTETGCSPPKKKPGIWGIGPNYNLWQFPTNVIDFDSISADFVDMKNQAINNGLYLAPSDSYGYHIVLITNGTFNVYKITNAGYYDGYLPPGEGLGANGVGGCRKRYQNIVSEQLIGTYSVNDNSIVFAEDNLWIEGILDGRITIAAAGFPLSASTMDIWIPNNITYKDGPGNDSLGIIAQNNVMFTRDLPNDFVVNGVLMAQKGQILRHGYLNNCGYSSTYSLRNSLTINGSLISYNKSYWNYGSPVPVSGFITRTINYDSNNLFSPPPYFPTSGNFEFISWKEE